MDRLGGLEGIKRLFRKKHKQFAEDFNDLDILESINTQYKEYFNKETLEKVKLDFH